MRDVHVMVLVRHVDRPEVLRVKSPTTGLWDLPSGMLGLGELVPEAAVRIVHEQCGLWVRAVGLLAFEQGPPGSDASPGAVERWSLVVDGGLAGDEPPDSPAVGGPVESRVHQWADLRQMEEPSGVVAWSLMASRADSLVPLLADGRATLPLLSHLTG